ncbi:MAG: hypothetical protein RL481_269 [Pseudomonadota bacterium]|jgi:hypothetical protein
MPQNFADNPSSHFQNSAHAAHHLPRVEVEPLQFHALQARFAALRHQLPPLTALADAQSISDIPTLDAAAQLLFPHGFYKSYPERLLEEQNFAAMTRWLSRLTAHDLSPVMDRGFAGLDDWLDALDNETPLTLYHSSGTTGRMSFHPRGTAEEAVVRDTVGMTIADNFPAGQFTPGEWNYALFWPAHAFGRTAALRIAKMLVDLLCADVSDFHPLLPTVLSADYHYHVLRSRNMRAQGFAFDPVASDYVRGRIAEAEALQLYVPDRLQEFADIIAALGEEKRVMIAGGPANIHSILSAGLARGASHPALPGSIYYSFGGYKDAAVIDTLDADAARYLPGILHCEAYGMTEISGTTNKCAGGRFHVPPWIIPYVLDPVSGQLLPREGVQRGRAAFMDLLPQSHWGGVISSDAVELSWQPCACGRNSPHIAPGIERIADRADMENHIGPAKASAIDAALEALREGLPVSN